MWVAYALVSAALLGLYDVFKKKSLQGNAVIPVLLINTVICTLFFLPSIIGSMTGTIPPESSLYIPNYCCPLKVSEQRDIHPQCCCNGIADDFSEGKPLS